MKGHFLVFALITLAWGQGNFSSNDCFREADKVYGSIKGVNATDLPLLNPLSADHRLYQIKGCTNSFELTGIQVTAAVFNGDVVDHTESMTAFGSATNCTTDTFAAGEIVTNMTVYYTANRLFGVGYSTSTGRNVTMGSTTNPFVGGSPMETYSFKFNEEFIFMGFLGMHTPD